MKNSSLVQDYLRRSNARLKAIETLAAEKSWADVVRESQEVVELALKALLRNVSIEVPWVHDVSDMLLDNRKLFSGPIVGELENLAEISRTLRRDREHAFYGSEDLTPSDFYREKDAKRAREQAREVVRAVMKAVKFQSDPQSSKA